MINIGKSYLTMDQLRAIDVERPDFAGDKWKGIKHSDLVDSLVHGIESREGEVVDCKFDVLRNGAVMIGDMQVDLRAVDGVPEPQNGMCYSMAFHHANDQSSSVKVAVGATVFICTNGMVSGDAILKRKHTLHLDLNAEVNKMLDVFFDRTRKINETIDILKMKNVTPVEVDHYLMSGARKGIVPWSHLRSIHKEFINPDPGNPESKSDTAWGLYNAMSYNARRRPSHAQAGSLSRFRELLVT